MDPPCAVCTHPVTDECEAIGCDGCGNWQHRKCNTDFVSYHGELVTQRSKTVRNRRDAAK